MTPPKLQHGLYVVERAPRKHLEPGEVAAELESRIRLGDNFDRYLPIPTLSDAKLHFFERWVPAIDAIPSICGHATFGDRIMVNLLDAGASEASGLIDSGFIDSVRVAVEAFAKHLCAHCVTRALG